MSRHHLYLVCYFLLPVLYFLLLPISVGDLAIWVALGKQTWLTGQIVHMDPFSVLPTQEQIYPFLTSLIYSTIYSFADLKGVSLVHKLVLPIISIIWYRNSVSRFESPWSLRHFLLFLFSWIGFFIYMIDRPALIAVVPFLLSFLILNKKEDLSWREIAALNFMNILWVNIHGSWILLTFMFVWREIGKISVLFAQQNLRSYRLQKSFVTALSLVLTSLLNPFGWKIFNYPLQTAAISRERKINEWDLTFFSQFNLQETLFGILIIISIVSLWRAFQKNRHLGFELLASPFFFILLMGVLSIRNTALAFLLLPLMAGRVGLLKNSLPIARKTTELQKILNLSISVLIIFLTFSALPPWRHHISGFLPENKAAVFDSSAPYEFAKLLNRTKDNDPIFNDWDYGSFLALEQRHPIFIDTRNIIYDREAFLEYLTVIEAQSNWPTIIEKYKIKYVLLDRKLRVKLISDLRNLPEWKLVSENQDTILFVKDK